MSGKKDCVCWQVFLGPTHHRRSHMYMFRSRLIFDDFWLNGDTDAWYTIVPKFYVDDWCMLFGGVFDV